MGVEEFQPTKLSRWIAGTTIPLAIGATGLYEVLQKLGLAVELLAEPQVRLLLGLGVFSLGMVALNVSLVRHITALGRTQFSQRQLPAGAITPAPTAPTKTLPKPHIPKRLDEIDVAILRHLARLKSSPTSEITRAVQKERALVEFHLIELEKARHVFSTHATSDSFWFIDQEGRRALVDRGLLK